MNGHYQEIEQYFQNLTEAIQNVSYPDINRVIEVIRDYYEREKDIYIFGNGGCASTSSHMFCDLNKSCSYGKKKRFRVHCLNDNIPILTAYSNDVSYDDVFVEQLKNYLKPEELVIALSGSGNSKNVLKAVEYANNIGTKTIGFCGFNGGKLKELAQMSLHLKVQDMQIAEDLFLVVSHIFMKVFMGAEIGKNY